MKADEKVERFEFLARMQFDNRQDELRELREYFAALRERVERLEGVKAAALVWRKSWVDVEDEEEEREGCKCEVCNLIRVCDEFEKGNNHE